MNTLAIQQGTNTSYYSTYEGESYYSGQTEQRTVNDDDSANYYYQCDIRIVRNILWNPADKSRLWNTFVLCLYSIDNIF